MITAWLISLIALLICVVIANGDDNDNSVAVFAIMFTLIGVFLGISICLAITSI